MTRVLEESVGKNKIETPAEARSRTPSLKSSSRTSSRTSCSSSLLARQRAKLEAAKTRLTFTQKEIELQKQQAHREAEAIRQRVHYESDLQYLRSQQAAAEAQAELDAMCEQLEDYDNVSKRGSLPLPAMDSRERTEKYVKEHSQTGTHERSNRVEEVNVDTAFNHNHYQSLPQHTEQTSRPVAGIHIDSRSNSGPTRNRLDPDAPSFLPEKHEYSDFTKYLLRKDLLLHRFTAFDDKPENFGIWKATFQSVVKELCVTPNEEFDLIVKWLGPESKKHALSLRASNTTNPANGLRRLWERLQERYGSPEMVESSLKKKLEKFPKLSNKDNSKLYDLSDILSEVESVMEDPLYAGLLGYFNTSSGVLPIVGKLPRHLQGKWTVRAAKYKKNNGVAFPPFSQFVAFIREMSSMLNDPGLVCKETTGTHARFQSNIRVAKTQVAKTQVSGSEEADNSKQNKKQCPVHNTCYHSINQCRSFRQKSLSERRRLLSEHGICFRCCESNNHIFKNCKVSIKCKECNSEQHPTALHPRNDTLSVQRNTPNKFGKSDSEGSSQHGGEKDDGVVNKCTRVCGREFSGRSCSKTILVKVHPTDRPDQATYMYAILDDQSNRTLCRPSFFHTMNIPGGNMETYTLVSCSGNIHTEGRCASGFSVSSIGGNFTVQLPSILECAQIPDNRSEIPTPEVIAHHRHLKDVDIPPLDPESEILLLIGRDVPEAHHVREQIIGPPNSPFAQRINLGWEVIGRVCLGSTHPPDPLDISVLKTSILRDGRPTLFPPCDNQFNVNIIREESNIGQDVFRQTQDDNKVDLSIEDREFLKLMDKEFVKDSQGKWTAPLPFREPRPRLPNNRHQALKRAQILDASLQRNHIKRDHLVTFMKGILDNGHAEVAPPLSGNEECWYLPLFSIYHPKKPDKIRGVFDSSAKHEGIALNEVLMKGPDLTNNLLGILLRFRKEDVAISCDVEQMFYCFGVREDHRNYLRFLWYEDNDPAKRMIEYRMCKHVFGNSPSPAVATYGLRKTAQESKNECGSDVCDFIENNFYVDDGLKSVPTAQEAISLLNRTKEALSRGNIRLHKFTSNCTEVLNAMPPEDLASDLRKIEIGIDSLPTQRSLGLCWILETDVFTFNIPTESKPYTRRGVLSTINSLFDPLGFLSPVTVQGKILLRNMVAGTVDWDQPLPDEFKEVWEQWDTSIQELGTFQIPRRYPTHTDTSTELHIYSDASREGNFSCGLSRIG